MIYLVLRETGGDETTLPLIRFSAVCGILSPVIFAFLTAVLGMLEPGYSHTAEVVSMLGATDAPYSLLQRSNFVISGLLLIIFAGALHRTLNEDKWGWIGPALLGLAGIGWVGAGIFPIVGGGQAPVQWSAASSVLHEAAAGVFFFGMIAAMYFLSRRLSTDPQWQGYDRYSKWASVTALGIILFYGASGSDGAGVLPDGFLQRLYLTWIGIWVVLLSVHLFRQS